MSDYGGGDDDMGMEYGAGEDNMDNLIEEENFVEDYDANGGMDVDDFSAVDRQNQLDSTDYQNNVVESGDVEAQTRAKALNTVKGIKDRKIPTDKRTTTPYMTKYERARVLGTRALQIRYAPAARRERWHFRILGGTRRARLTCDLA
ncbi:subunit common to RNA polymerases I, II, and III [Saxophila tyrrhenica]|uniref:Subunit common to RNA polymerases I, II, and III n=1 Tax=Saxophila tyrrhenica TaxID=1690608 RepID=A0AAV9PGP1_9PEZI|nr:subunit common to RNA polymerases I, II, and III [Saxophila tyrrhenica]